LLERIFATSSLILYEGNEDLVNKNETKNVVIPATYNQSNKERENILAGSNLIYTHKIVEKSYKIPL
jgi:hypothetical protein